MSTFLNLGVVKVEHLRHRGWRVGVGPRWLRRWYGAGSEGVSTGTDPVIWYKPLRRRSRRRRSR